MNGSPYRSVSLLSAWLSLSIKARLSSILFAKIFFFDRFFTSSVIASSILGLTFKLGARFATKLLSISIPSSSIPMPLAAETGTTLTPSLFSSSAMSIVIPHASNRSTMFKATITGISASSTCVAKNRLRLKLVASTTMITRSGRGRPVILPSKTSTAIISSGDCAVRE